MENNIVSKIIADAEERAAAVIAEAENKARFIRQKTDSEIDALRSGAESEKKKRMSAALQAAEVKATLELKKAELGAEKSVMDVVFDGAKRRVRELNKKEYLKLVEAMLSYAESGDTVKISALDKDVITESFVKKVADKLKIKLKLSKTYVDITGGVILSGKNADKNLSIEADLKEIRELTEPEAARILFGEVK